ncbi:ATP-binding protein [Streptomyces niveiscabiei]|uniref:ATP-binding protein n=1 Tax=Streptomyces niveiscabiei TaxID=164115 RepID=UPI0029B88804|nr:ATP-binding protein [Streptomyces niveiscabiei]MDX3385339.1 ATP-binding protein [Streptomyces niveiscabiei]
MAAHTTTPQTTSHQYPRLHRTVPLARDDLRRQLARWRIGGELADNAELLLSELVTNAVNAKTLPGREILVEVALTERELRIEVADASDEQPELRHAGALDEGGRGLVLVDALATEWGTGARDGVGKVVWVTLNLP